MLGYVLLDKGDGPSSHAAVQQVRRALGIGGKRGTKGGHAGTLDPFASGLLVVLLGGATRLMPFIVGHDKRYLVTVRFGASSSTDDREGELIASDAPLPDRDAIAIALAQLSATTEQVPPAVSAIHVDGVRAYQRVRRGETIDVPARPVRFDAIDLVSWDAEAARAILDVRCSAGTYMRALARDLGELVGCPAYCEELRRTEVGEWCVNDAVRIEDLSRAHVRDALELIPHLPRIQLDEHALSDVVAGRRLPIERWLAGGTNDGPHALVAPSGELAAIAETTSDGTMLQPRIVLARAA